MTTTLTMESRVGRTNQRYTLNGERLVAGVVPLSADKSHVLLIQSARAGRWVLPKGGWELDEASASQAACREAWEEAGVVVSVVADLGEIQDMRTPAQMCVKKGPRILYRFFEVRVEREEEVWPEKHKRVRRWVRYEEAVRELGERPELLEALNRSSVKR